MRGRSVSLRALHVIGGGDVGGAMSHLLALLPALRSAGCDAHLLCLGEGGLARAARDLDLPVRVVPMSGPWDPRALRPVWRALTGQRWDVVHTHGMRANLPVRAMWRAGAGSHAGCLFVTVHSDLGLDYEDALRARLFPTLDRFSVGVVDRVLCVSEDLRDRLVARGGDPSRLRVVRSGLTVVAGAPTATQAGDAGIGGRAAAAVANEVWAGDVPRFDVPRLGTVARLVPVKDIDLFLEVSTLVAREVAGLRVAVVGEGPELDRLRARAAALALGRVVTFPGEVRPGSEVVREFDVFLLTSVSEGVPISVLEAMAAGVPVVATDVGGISEAVEDGVTGLLVTRDADREAVARELADEVVSLLSDPVKREAMGSRAAERARKVFGAEAAAAATLAEYRSCLRVRGHGVERSG